MCFSATNKWRLRCVLYLHFSLLVMMLLRLSTSIFVGVGVRPPRLLQRMQFPRGLVWEYYWLLSVLPAVVGFLALRRSKPIMIQQYFLGTLIFGVLPALYGIFDQCDDMILYWRTKEATVKFRGFPMVVLWNMFLAVILQVHGFGLGFAWALWNAWTPRGGKKAR